ncbi:MAG: hypothetical protein R2762_30590 [Bryobacteraceae bacterium]
MVLSAELAGHYKPDIEVYQMAAHGCSGCRRMVADGGGAHKNDLRGAAKAGFLPAFVEREFEFGPLRTPDMAARSPTSTCMRGIFTTLLVCSESDLFPVDVVGEPGCGVFAVCPRFVACS